MQKYYTAVGRFERKGRMGDMTCPMVIINNGNMHWIFRR